MASESGAAGRRSRNYGNDEAEHFRNLAKIAETNLRRLD